MEEIITIKNRKGLSLSIKLNISPERNKLIFLEHGLGARKDYPHMKVIEDVFASHGFNVVNIDATNSNNDSQHSPDGITFTGHYEDLEDVINWAKNKNFYVEPFALAGHSLGAQSVVLYASRYQEKVDLLLPISFCWIDGKQEISVNKRTKIILEQGYFEQVSKSTGRKIVIKKNYLDDMATYDFSKFAKNITADTFLIIGAMDSDWHKQNTQSLYNLLNCKKQLNILENVPHDLANTPQTKQTFSQTLTNILDSLLLEF